MMDRACHHGYHDCNRCVEEANERARRVAEHYSGQLKPGGTITEPTYHAGPVEFVGKIPVRQDIPVAARRCKCGSKLLAPEALQTGRCHYCRNSTTPPWTTRCECGSGLMGRESIQTGQCYSCRYPDEPYTYDIRAPWPDFDARF